MIDVKKKDSENEYEYIWRLCQAKDNGLLDMDWESLGELFNRELRDDDIEWTSSTYRKPYQNAKVYYENVFKNMIDDKKITSDIDEKTRLLIAEREKLNSTKAEYRKDIRHQSRFELFYENVKNEINCLPVPDLAFIPMEDENETEYLLTIADIHAGANFSSINNSYSLEICRLRFEKLLNETMKFVTNKNLTHLNIVEMGDSIQGILRISDVKLNETSIVEATVFVSKLISNFLNELSACCEINYYQVPSSNHSQIRPLGTKASELATEDIEYIIFNYITDSLKNNPRIHTYSNFGEEYLEITLNDYRIIAMHGHQIKNINNSLRDLSCLHKQFYDCVLLAHFHGGHEITAGEKFLYDTEILVCPSFVGSDPYSDTLTKGSKSACKIYGFTECKGHTETYKIVL